MTSPTPPSWPFPSVTDPSWLTPPGGRDPYLDAARSAVLTFTPASGDTADGTAVERALTAAREVADRLDWVLLSLVGEARGAGASWEDVGAALGVSKQAAHKRFAPYVAAALEQAREHAHPDVDVP